MPDIRRVSLEEVSWSRHDVFVDSEKVAIYRASPAVDAVPLVFLHGWGLSPRSYRETLEKLAQSGFSVTAPALPGFGGSSSLAEPAKDTFARIVERVSAALVAEDVSDEPYFLVGHSLGAGVAVGVASKQPSMVSGLALLCPVGGGSTGTNTWARLANGFRREIGQHPLSRLIDAVPSFLAHPAGIVAAGVAAKEARLSGEIESFAGLGRPVYVVKASEDGVVETESLREIPGVAFHEVVGGHGWPLAESESCSALLKDFSGRLAY